MMFVTIPFLFLVGAAISPKAAIFPPIEYRSASNGGRHIVGFHGDYVYDAFDTESLDARIRSESQSSLHLEKTTFGYATSFPPVLVVKNAHWKGKVSGYECASKADQIPGVILISCLFQGKNRFESAYDPKKGVLWFDYLCYPGICRFYPVGPRLMFSPEMLRKIEGRKLRR